MVEELREGLLEREAISFCDDAGLLSRKVTDMADERRQVETHYTVGGLEERILAALTSMGKELDDLTPADLALVDEFHIRGREATEELARLAGLGPDLHVLDIGCGLGGSTRYLASEHDCRATGLDLTEEYCRVAARFSERLRISDRTDFLNGDALEMPFEEGTFDLVWTEHAQMNIADKKRFYGEIARVLKPSGRFVFHDVFQGDGGDPFFPVPWAGDPSISSLIAPRELERLLRSLGLRTYHWEDKTQISLDWFRNALESIKVHGPPPLGLHLLMGTDSRVKLENQLLNLEQGRTLVVQAVLEKTGQAESP